MPPPDIRTDKTIAVVDSQNAELLESLSHTGLLAVTCGLSSRDTITLSSIAPDSAVINLQRSISCFDGTVAEPQEFPVTLSSPIDSFILMSAATAFILGGRSDDICSINFTPSKK